MNSTNHTEGELKPQVGQSSMAVNPFKQTWLSTTPHPEHKSLKAHGLSTTPKQRKYPYSPSYMGRGERHKISAPKSTYPVEPKIGTSGPLRATPIDTRPFAKAHRIRGQRRKSCELSSHSPVTPKDTTSPETQLISPAKRPRTPLGVGQIPVKNDALGKTASEFLLENVHTRTFSGTQSERPSPKKRCTVPRTNSQIKGGKIIFKPIPSHRRRASIKRRAKASGRKSEPEHFRASRRRAAFTEGVESDKSVGKREFWDFEFEHLEEEELKSFAEATSKLVGRVPRSEILRILGDIEEMAERYTDLLRLPLTESPGEKSREDTMLEIERCRDAASGQLLGLCSEDSRTGQLAILFGRQGPIYGAADSNWRNRIAEGIHRLEGLKSFPGAPDFSSTTGTRQHGSNGSAEGGKAVADEHSRPDSVPDAIPLDLAYRKKENRRDGSSSGSDREQGAFGDAPRSKHYVEDSDEDKSEEMAKLSSRKGKGRATDEDGDTLIPSLVNSVETQTLINYDEEIQEDSHAHRSRLPQGNAEAIPGHASPPRGTLDAGISSAATSDRSRPQNRRSSRHSAKWRRDSSRHRNLPSGPGGILKKGHSGARVSPKRVRNMGRRNSQAETEVATVTYLPESAPAASRTLGIPVGEDLLSVVIDVPPPKPGSKTQPLGSGPDEQVETLSHLTGDPGSAQPGALYDKSDRLAERKLIRKEFRRRRQSDGSSAGTSRSVVKARLRGVRNAKLIGRPVTPGEDEDPALFDSDLDELGSDAATTKILKAGSYDDAEWDSESKDGDDDDSDYDHGYRVRSLLTPVETGDMKKKQPQRRSSWTYQAAIGTDTPDSMIFQQGSCSPGGTPSIWTGHRDPRRSKSTSPIEAAKRGFSGMFGSVAHSPSSVSEAPSTGSLRRKMKRLLLKPLKAAESKLPIRTSGISHPSSSRTSPTGSPPSSSVYPSSRTSAESSQTPQFIPTPKPLWNTDTWSSPLCAPDCRWTHRHKRSTSHASPPTDGEQRTRSG
ncbi:MAG: hypothetical protein M1840_006766 [Geoglossum simile]|nr:MAG: hypothetical protein M1840_006766 [Geoglossum simile]